MKLFAKIRSLVATDREVRKIIEKRNQRRKELDDRLDKIAVATLDGEWDWFLQLKKIDPTCAMKVIRECDRENDS